MGNSRTRSQRRVHPLLRTKSIRQTPVEGLPRMIMENIERERIEEEERTASSRNEKGGTSEKTSSYDGAEDVA